MRLLFVADGRSPTARQWLRYFAQEHETVLVSSFFCEMDFPLKRLEFAPVAFSALKKRSRLPSSSTLGWRTVIRSFLGPLTVPRASRKLRALIEEIQPDLVHALRIPYEGMLASEALKDSRIPLVVSVWGNDFTLHAPSTPLMSYYTKRTLKRASALHADCERDIRLARRWGLKEDKPTLVAPGNGGIRTEIFYPPNEPVTAPVVVNPRGFRAYVRNDAFFQSIPLVLAQVPEARFICSSMAGEPQALAWIKRLGVERAVQLDPPMPHAQMANVFRGAQVVVSPSVHDGTPNALLEALACGCFPVAGDLESIREWITPGQNGLLFDSNDPASIAASILAALKSEDLRLKAAGLNARLIAARAEYRGNMEKALAFYKEAGK